MYILKHFMGAPLYDTRRGYITLISVLIVSAIVVSVAVTLLLIGVNATRTTAILQATKYANTLAKSCVEEALGRINLLNSFAGSGGINFGDGSCDYNVINSGGQNRLVTATGTTMGAIRRISVSVDALTPKINISSLQEVADF